MPAEKISRRSVTNSLPPTARHPRLWLARGRRRIRSPGSSLGLGISSPTESNDSQLVMGPEDVSVTPTLRATCSTVRPLRSDRAAGHRTSSRHAALGQNERHEPEEQPDRSEQTPDDNRDP
jgi:hypothetical protein